MKINRGIWILIFVYVVIFSALSCLRHYHFDSLAWDLGIFDQSFWNAIHGRSFSNSLEEIKNHLGVHFSPWLFVLLPLYALFQSPYCLLVAQTVALGMGAFPLYLIMEKLKPTGPWPLLISAAYLLYPSLEWANMYDFHEVPFFIPLFLSAFYFMLEKKWGWMYFFLCLSASVKENAVVTILFFGIYLITQKSMRRHGLTVIAGSMIYFILATRVFMPSYGGGFLFSRFYAELGSTPLEIIFSLVTKPGVVLHIIAATPKLLYLLWLFLPILFLPGISGWSVILILPGLAENILSNYQYQVSSQFHYDCILIPGLFIATCLGIKTVIDYRQKFESAFRILFCVASLAVFALRSPIGFSAFPLEYFSSNDRQAAYQKMIHIVPENISVATHNSLVPHLTHREKIYLLGAEPSLVDMVLFDLREPLGFSGPKEFQAYLDRYTTSGLYDTQVISERYFVIARKEIKAATL